MFDALNRSLYSMPMTSIELEQRDNQGGHRHGLGCNHGRRLGDGDDDLYPFRLSGKLEYWLEKRSNTGHRNRLAALGFAVVSFAVCPLWCPIIDDVVLPVVSTLGSSVPSAATQDTHPDWLKPRSMWVVDAEGQERVLTLDEPFVSGQGDEMHLTSLDEQGVPKLAV